MLQKNSWGQELNAASGAIAILGGKKAERLITQEAAQNALKGYPKERATRKKKIYTCVKNKAWQGNDTVREKNEHNKIKRSPYPAGSLESITKEKRAQVPRLVARCECLEIKKPSNKDTTFLSWNSQKSRKLLQKFRLCVNRASTKTVFQFSGKQRGA